MKMKQKVICLLFFQLLTFPPHMIRLFIVGNIYLSADKSIITINILQSQRLRVNEMAETSLWSNKHAVNISKTSTYGANIIYSIGPTLTRLKPSRNKRPLRPGSFSRIRWIERILCQSSSAWEEVWSFIAKVPW